MALKLHLQEDCLHLLAFASLPAGYPGILIAAPPFSFPRIFALRIIFFETSHISYFQRSIRPALPVRLHPLVIFSKKQTDYSENLELVSHFIRLPDGGYATLPVDESLLIPQYLPL